MTHPHNQNPTDEVSTNEQKNQPTQVVLPEIKENDNIRVLNLRWQEIRKWELNRLRVQQLNHQLAFTKNALKNGLKTAFLIKAKNDTNF